MRTLDLIQQNPGCADFDVVLEGSRNPAFRVLVPERILARGLRPTTALHVLPGVWIKRSGTLRGKFGTQSLELNVDLIPQGSILGIKLVVASLGEDLRDVWADVCAGINHLPGNPGWCNRVFMPGVPLNRALQGRYWYESVTPRDLRALVGARWVTIHPDPLEPDADAVAEYSFSPGRRPNAKACACRAPGGQLLFFQAWRAPARYLAPFPGNACMHMQPFLARRLEAGSPASVAGIVGIHRGDFRNLAPLLDRWRQEG